MKFKVNAVGFLAVALSHLGTSVIALRGAPSQPDQAKRELAFGTDLAQSQSNLDEVCLDYRLDHSLLPEIYGKYRAEIPVTVTYDEESKQYWGVTFNDDFYATGEFAGWCGNLELKMDPGNYRVDVWSSYSHPNFQSEAVDKEMLLWQVNWLFNNYQVDDDKPILFNTCSQLASYTGTITRLEYQMAVWLLIDDAVTPQHDDSMDGVDTMVAYHLMCEAQAQESEYVPDCTDPDERLAVVLIFDNNQGVIKEQTILVDYLLSDTDICVCKEYSPVAVNPGGAGDPHFETWTGDKYDFHGICDLVLLQNPGYRQGDVSGMDIHIRTKQTKAWSFIFSMVLRIGSERLEVRGSPEDDEVGMYWLNGVFRADLSQGIAGFGVKHERSNKKQHVYTVDLPGRAVVSIKTFKEMIRVNVVDGERSDFGGSMGMMGSFDGEWLGRDGRLILDPIALGMEWQVQPDEPMLFVDVEGVQAPTQCAVPSELNISRRLEEVGMTLEEAELACARVSEADRDSCIFDVLATNDKEYAGAY